MLAGTGLESPIQSAALASPVGTVHAARSRLATSSGVSASSLALDASPMAIGLFGLIGPIVVILVLGGIVAAIVRGTRSSRAADDGEGGGGMGIAAVLIAIGVLVVAGGGALFFSFASSVSMVVPALSRPAPGQVGLWVQGTDVEVEQIAQSFDTALKRSLAATVKTRNGGFSSGVYSNFGRDFEFISKTFDLVPAQGNPKGPLPPDALDFETLRLEFEFAASGFVSTEAELDRLTVVVGYHSVDREVETAAELQWVDGSPQLVVVEPNTIYPSFGSTGPEDDDVQIIPFVSNEPIVPVPTDASAPDPPESALQEPESPR